MVCTGILWRKLHHNEFFHKDSFGKCAGRTYISALRQNAEMYVTCTVLNKDCAVEANIIFIGPPPCTFLYPAGPKSGGTLFPTPLRLRHPCEYRRTIFAFRCCQPTTLPEKNTPIFCIHTIDFYRSTFISTRSWRQLINKFFFLFLSFLFRCLPDPTKWSAPRQCNFRYEN